MHKDVLKEHEWLTGLAGEWSYEGDCFVGPDKPRQQFSGVETVRTLGDIWIIAEGKGQMPDGTAGFTLLTLGYEPENKRYVGSWIGSMMNRLWVYEAKIEVPFQRLALHSEGPSFAGDGTIVPYKDVVEILSDDHRTFSGHVQEPNGDWREFMTAHYRRWK